MTQTLPTLSNKEHVILDLLVTRGEMIGSEMVEAVPSDLKPGTIYVMLWRMADRRLVRFREVKESGTPGRPKRLFEATDFGARVARAYAVAAEEMRR